MPEPKHAVVDGPDPGGHRGCPGRAARKPGKLTVLQCGKQEQTASIGVTGEPRRERLLEARR
jgi:hypothetical protein